MGVHFGLGGTVTNQNGGKVNAAAAGVYIEGWAGVVINAAARRL